MPVVCEGMESDEAGVMIEPLTMTSRDERELRITSTADTRLHAALAEIDALRVIVEMADALRTAMSCGGKTDANEGTISYSIVNELLGPCAAYDAVRFARKQAP